jgi:alkyl hydroperoxide reductase subunit AhpC
MQTATVDVGDEVPDFNLESQLGPIAFHDLIHSKWGLLVTVQGAFDPVATTVCINNWFYY